MGNNGDKEIYNSMASAIRSIMAAHASLLAVIERVFPAPPTTIPPSNIARIKELSNGLRDPDLAYRILDELAAGIILVDKDGIIRLVNKQTEAMFGYSRFELDGAKLSLLIPPRFQDAHAEHFKAYFAHPHKRPMMCAARHGLKLNGVRKDGTEIPLDISLTPIISPQDTYIVALTKEKMGE